MIPAGATMMHTRYNGISRLMQSSDMHKGVARTSLLSFSRPRRASQSVGMVAEVDDAARAYFRSKTRREILLHLVTRKEQPTTNGLHVIASQQHEGA
jgi:hypothetical protein